MLWNAKNGTVSIYGRTMNYISFGKGDKNLILLLGLGDGFQTVQGMAYWMAWGYRIYARDYRVYMFSRCNELPEGFTTRQMAKDQALAMEALGIERADIVGISQGGMIAQYLAVDYPQKVDKLVLAMTCARQSFMSRNLIAGWIELARKQEYKKLMIDTAEKSYSRKHLRFYRLLYPFLGLYRTAKDFSRFIIQASSCLNHDAYLELDKIQAPTFVIGGGQDDIVGAIAFLEMVDRIPDCRPVHIYPDLGHAAYEEAPDFHQRILAFLKMEPAEGQFRLA